MLTAKTVKTWYLVHKWTSLISTVFLLMLCITGLPLIFYHEIDEITGNAIEVPQEVAVAGPADLDRVVAAGLAEHKGDVALYLGFDDHEPIIYLTTAPTSDAAPDEARFLAFDARTGDLLATPKFTEGVMYFLFRLHVDMFTGLPGELFLGAMGLLLAISIVSGVVVYGPFMRKLEFGTVRKRRSTRVKWLDLHNLLGIVTIVWVMVVGLTGVINTLATPIRALWQMGQLAEMTAPYASAPPLVRLGSVDAAVGTTKAAAPDMVPSFVAFPGTPFSSQHHYAVFMTGNTPLTSKLLTPALIDAETGTLTDMREMPWYVQALFISQPLHFGDYGGLPLKIVWALLDLVTIIVLGSGIYLWLGRRRTSSIESRLAELSRSMPGAEGHPS